MDFDLEHLQPAVRDLTTSTNAPSLNGFGKNDIWGRVVSGCTAASVMQPDIITIGSDGNCCWTRRASDHPPSPLNTMSVTRTSWLVPRHKRNSIASLAVEGPAVTYPAARRPSQTIARTPTSSSTTRTVVSPCFSTTSDAGDAEQFEGCAPESGKCSMLRTPLYLATRPKVKQRDSQISWGGPASNLAILVTTPCASNHARDLGDVAHRTVSCDLNHAQRRVAEYCGE
jgi:hypothetical protein